MLVDFDFDGKTYRGTYQPIVSRELWQSVQEIIQQSLARRRQKQKARFRVLRDRMWALRLQHGGRTQKESLRLLPLHWQQGKCPEPYVREEVLEKQFTAALRRLKFDDEVLAWVKQALRQSHADERRDHEETIARLQAEHTKIQRRLDAMYDDKLDLIDEALFRRKADECSAEQSRLSDEIERRREANQNYIEDGARLLDLVNKAADLFEKQPTPEKRKPPGIRPKRQHVEERAIGIRIP